LVRQLGGLGGVVIVSAAFTQIVRWEERRLLERFGEDRPTWWRCSAENPRPDAREGPVLAATAALCAGCVLTRPELARARATCVATVGLGAVSG
jgi:hypothetical protein